MTATIHIESLHEYLTDLAGKIHDLYELVPDYVMERENVKGEIEDQINALMSAAMEGHS